MAFFRNKEMGSGSAMTSAGTIVVRANVRPLVVYESDAALSDEEFDQALKRLDGDEAQAVVRLLLDHDLLGSYADEFVKMRHAVKFAESQKWLAAHPKKNTLVGKFVDKTALSVHSVCQDRQEEFLGFLQRNAKVCDPSHAQRVFGLFRVAAQVDARSELTKSR